jgi:hypothetical protein
VRGHLNQVGREPSLGGDRREGSLDQAQAVASPGPASNRTSLPLKW